MTVFVKATYPPAAKNMTSVRVALAYAAILVVFVVAQLFSFEEFLPLVGDYALPGNRLFAYFLAAFIVMAEVFALPFLLRMRLSPAMRVVSMVLGWIVALFWVFIAVWLIGTQSTVENIGYLGYTVPIAPGLFTTAIAFLLAGMAAISSWGMWPLYRGKR